MKLERKHGITAIILIIAIAVTTLFAIRTHRYPKTRNGQVRANVVGIAPRVAGTVLTISVRDNQAVKKGDLLFEIDPAPYLAAVANAQAEVARATAQAKKSVQEMARQTAQLSSGATDLQAFQNAQDQEASTKADLAGALAELQIAELNLSYTKVFAPVNGYLTNVVVSPGAYAQAGQSLLALIDADSFWIAAYFVETDLAGLAEGTPLRVTFMGQTAKPTAGVVESIGWGIFLEDGSAVELLPQVAQTVDWVRLPNRFPVRVRLTAPPPAPLRIGQTVSVAVVGGP